MYKGIQNAIVLLCFVDLAAASVRFGEKGVAKAGSVEYIGII